MIDLNVLQQHGVSSGVADFDDAQASTVLVPAVAGKRITIWGFIFSSNDSGAFKLKSDGVSDISNWLYFNSGGSGFAADMLYGVCHPNESLTITSTIDGAHGITVWYTQA